MRKICFADRAEQVIEVMKQRARRGVTLPVESPHNNGLHSPPPPEVVLAQVDDLKSNVESIDEKD